MNGAVALAAFGLELRLWWRQRIAVAAALVLPVVAAVVISVALGALPTPKASWAVVDLDQVPAAQAFDEQVLGGDALRDLLSVRRVSLDEARRLVRRNEVHAAIVLPAGLTAEVAAGRPPQIEVLAPSRRRFGTDLADLVARQFAVRGWAVATAAAGGQPTQSAPWPLEVEVRAASGNKFDVAGHYGPSIGMFFVLMTLGFAAQTQVKHRANGITDRMRSTSAPPAMALVGRAAAGAVVGAISLVTTLTVMSLAFGQHWGSLGPLALLVAAVVVAYAGIGALIAALPRTPDQAVLLAIAVPFAFALASGSFAPPDAPVRPFGAWLAPPTHALDAFAELAVAHAGVSAIAGALIFLFTTGIAAGLAAALVERRR